MSPCVPVTGEFNDGVIGRIGKIMRTVMRFLAFLLLSMLSGPVNAAVHTVRPDGSGEYPTIQTALDASVNGDEVVLTSGVFLGVGNHGLDFRGKAVTLRSETGDSNSVTIDCEHRSPAFIFQSEETRDTRIDGITIVDGRDDPDIGWGGGAIFAIGASPTIRNCAFHGCDSEYGGVAALYMSSPLFQGCRFSHNAIVIPSQGGVIWALDANPEFEDCYFLDFNGSSQGGSIWASGSNLRIVGTVFYGQIGGDGGVMWLQSGSVVNLSRCTLNGNASQDGIISLNGGSALIADHTIIAFGLNGASVRCDVGSTAALSCCDIFGNEGGDWVGCLAGQDAGDGNLHADPIFCDEPGLRNWLRSDSPCAGDNNPECGQIGWAGVACQGPVPVVPTTWGKVRASFR